MANDKVLKQNRDFVHLQDLIGKLPETCEDYFISLEQSKAMSTRISYARDLLFFFDYISNVVSGISKTPALFTIDDLKMIKSRNINRYLSYLTSYTVSKRSYPDPEDKTNYEVIKTVYTNKDLSKKRKLSSIRSFYNYLHKYQIITENPTAIIDTPKIHEKPIIRMTRSEVIKLLDSVESGEFLTDSQQNLHNKVKYRDLALLTLLLGTGVRVSECVGIDINDIDFTQHNFVVTRKGGDREILYLNDEVEDALKDYMVRRKKITPVESHENAFFLSLQRKRINIRTVEKMVKKYTRATVPLKKITPHKFRSTFGTELYRNTGDIYLVADVLGHKDINTTRKHYAKITEDRRKMASQAVKIRNTEDIDE